MTRPQSLMQLWHASKQKNIMADVSTVQDTKEEAIPNGLPPPYTERPSQDRTEDAVSDTNSPYPILARYAERALSRRAGKFQWILVDIMATTFSTDVSSLKAALVKVDPGRTRVMAFDSFSIWEEEGRALVIEEKHLVEKMVLEPVEKYHLNLDFVLEILGRFKRGRDGCGPESTLLDDWKTPPRTTDLGDTIASHYLLLQKFVLEDKVRLVLEGYVAAFLKGNGLEELRTSKELQEESLVTGETCCWPLSDGYMGLARGVRALKTSCVIDDPYEFSRARLRERRNVASPERY